jgi:putative redox protein
MHQMTLKYSGGFRCEAVHLDSSNKIITDAPKDNQGQGQAFSPTDLMSTALASCMLTIMAMKAKALGVEFGEPTVELEKKMAANPRKVAELVLRFDWKGLDRKISPEVMAQLKDAAMNCPVALSLDPSVKKTLHW